MPGPLTFVEESPAGRIVVTDSLTYCDERVGARDVVVSGSFAGALALAFALERGVRAVVGHAAGVGRDGAGISGLALADRLGVPAAAVETMSARIGDGPSVWSDGLVAHVNERARAVGVSGGATARAAARAMLSAPAAARRAASLVAIDRAQRVVLEGPEGRVVLLGSASFAAASNARDVLCVGSHGGRVNALPLEAVRPRGAIFNDAGRARDDSGLGALPVLDAWGVAAATVAAMSARIGDPASGWDTGVISAANRTAAAAGVREGQPAREAGRLMLAPRSAAPRA